MPRIKEKTPAGEIRLFIPITKVDVAKRMVYGTLAAEIPDKMGEIMDYETAKVAIQTWSNEQSEITGGKSLGNVREMHSNIAAGKLTDIVFDDENKIVEGASKVVDDSTWQKIEEGVLTGFSIGGGYAKRWIDPANPQLKRYTPKVQEFSYVDNPCMPGATFEVVKVDGSVELRKFHTISAKEAQSPMTTTPENAAASAAVQPNLEVPAPEQVWRATDGSTHKSKKDALTKNAELLVAGVSAKTTEALAKLSDGLAAKEGDDAAAPGAAGESGAAAGPTADGAPAEGAQVIPAAAETSENPSPAAGADTPQAAAEKAAPATELKKGLYDVSRLADAIMCLNWLMQDAVWESKLEGDASTVPAQIKTALTTLVAALKAMVNEEADELLASTDEMIVVEVEKGAPVGALAKFIKADVDGLAKRDGAAAFVERLEKAASKTDKAHLAAMAAHHETMQKCMDGMAKCMKGLGLGEDENADDDKAEKMAKAAGLTDEQLAKLAAFPMLQKKFDELVPQLTNLTERLAKVEATPAETKGIMNTAAVIQKGHEGNGTGTSPAEAELQKMISAGASPEQTVHAMMKMALQKPVAVTQQ